MKFTHFLAFSVVIALSICAVLKQNRQLGEVADTITSLAKTAKFQQSWILFMESKQTALSTPQLVLKQEEQAWHIKELTKKLTAITEKQTPSQSADQTLTLTLTITGTRPDAPIPIQATLQLHTDGSVTWKRP